MQRRKKAIIVSGALVVSVAVGTVGIVAASGDDNDTPVTGPSLERATRAALQHMGEGRVTDTEIGDEDSFFEIEVTLDDGSQVDVQLDAEFNVVETMRDDEGDEEDTND